MSDYLDGLHSSLWYCRWLIGAGLVIVGAMMVADLIANRRDR